MRGAEGQSRSVDGKRATGVTYVDANGEEWEQPADIVLVCAYRLFNVRMMLLSGIGKPYDPASGKGAVGRNYAYQTSRRRRAFFEDKQFNPFIGAGALGVAIDDFNGDNFDHARLDFVGGAGITLRGHQRPADRNPPDRRRARRAGARSGRRRRHENYSASPASARRAAS